MRKTPIVVGASALAAVAGLGTALVLTSGAHHPSPPTVGSAAATAPRAARPAIYRRDDDTWYLRTSATTGVADNEFQYGEDSDIHFMGDWDGDGVKTPGVKRGSTFYLRNTNSAGPPDIVFTYGLDSDFPLVGDWNGDGTDTIGVRRDDGAWYLRNEDTTGVADVVFGYGLDSDATAVGDWDGDGTDTPAVVRFTGDQATFFERNSDSAGAADTEVTVDTGETDDPVVADWNGDGRDEVGFFHATLAHWDAGSATFHYGLAFDQAMTW